MINANELRIGNWIKGAYEFQIEEIRKDGIYAIYDPIPLTPEILESCGFEFLKGSQGWYEIFFDKYTLSYCVQNGEISIEDNFQIFIENKVVKHLHQLQNLYFALTGEELNVNLHVESTI